MGILDTLEEAAGLIGQNSAAGAPPQGAMGAVLQMLQAQPGGMMGIVQQFESAGLGGVARSWLADGQNQPLRGDQVQSALGAGPISQVAQQLGVPPDEAASHIAQLLPMILDHFSTGGQLPSNLAGGEKS